MRGMRGMWIAALAIFVGGVAFGLVGPAASQSQSSGQRQGAAARPQPKSPALKANVATTPAQEQGARTGDEAERDAKEREERAALDRHLVEATAALGTHGLSLTYATIGLIVVSASLWLMTFLQARDVRAAVRAVQETSAAARQSAELAQRALVLTQRATVIVGEPKAVWLRDAGDRLVGCRLLVSWHNVGTTPTKDMIAAVAGLATEKPPPQVSALPKGNARQQPAMVGPNAAINSAYVNLPIGLVADILQHKGYYLFAGWAEYNDVFENTPRHRVEFCYWLEFEGDLEAQRLEARFHLHGKHNRHCEALPAPVPADGSDAGASRPTRQADGPIGMAAAQA